MRTEPLLLLPAPPGVCGPALPCRSQEADEKEEERELRPGFSLSGTQLGLGLAQTSQMRDRVRDCTHPHLVGACSLPGSALATSAPRAASAWFLPVELPVWWADKETDHYNARGKGWGGRCLTSPRSQGGLPGGGGVYTHSRTMSGRRPDEVRAGVSQGVGGRKRGVRGSKKFHVAGMQNGGGEWWGGAWEPCGRAWALLPAE